MFKLSQSETYYWPVVLSIPASGGKYDKSTFEVEFARISQSRILEIRKSAEDGTLTDAELAREVVRGWKSIVDEDGEDMPFTDSHLNKLLNVALVSGAIVKAFMESLSGYRQKN